MTNYDPTITSSNATGSFSENANTTGSNALHTLSGTMNFTDKNKTDAHTTSASLKSAVLSNGSVIPATSLSHLNSAMSSIIQSDSNGSGKLKWTFGAEDDDFDFLAKNQTLTLTYEIKLFDNHGGSTKKTVTVTITGTDDKPVIDFGVFGVVSERVGQTLSLLPDTVNVAVHFVDVDLTNTGHTASVVDVSASGATGGLLPGILGELELRSFFSITSVVKASGSSNGTINTRFSAPDLAFDYLSEGETIDITYTIKLNDNAGGITTQTVVITVVGTNDAPHYLSGPDTEHLVEGENLSPGGDLTACGDLLFADIDLSDGHTVSTTVAASRSGGGVVPLTQAELLAALSTDVDPDSTNHLLGEVDWAFALDNSDVSFLNSGETLTIVYTLTLTDDAGGTDTQTVTVTILGTNDPVIVTSGPGAASLAEFADVTGDPTPNGTSPVPTGSITFTDSDVGDTHTVNVTVAAATWSGGSTPAATLAGLPAALLTTLNDSTGTGSGSVDWSFSIPDFDLDFLAAGETLTVDYEVAISDGPTSASQTVTITIDGANDLPVITSGPGSASLEEQIGQTGSSDPVSSPVQTLSFTDVDLNDTHTVSVLLNNTVWSTGGGIPGQTEFDLAGALLVTLNDSTGSGAGTLDWSFSIPDFDLDFLGSGETLTVTYDIVVADGFASSTQSVTITITGAEDPLVVNPLAATVTDTVATDDGQLLFLGNVITDAGDSAGDLSTTLEVSAVNGSPANVGTPISGAYGDLFILADGTYLFIANGNLDLLAQGATDSEIYTFTVTDSLGRSETETLTLNFTGSNEAPTVTSAVAAGSVTEDRGPTVLVNGDFETGDLSGWTASSPNITAEFLANGGVFENYTVRLAPGPTATLSQSVATVAGQTYTLTFYVSGDAESTDNQFTASWGGAPVLVLNDNQLGLMQYSMTVVAGPGSSTLLEFSYFDDGIAMYLDHVQVLPASGPATEETDGSVSFADADAADTHTASFAPLDMGYFGTFSLDAVVEGPGSGSVAWHFTVDNADIQFLAEGETLTQTYTVFVTDNHGASVAQDVTVEIVGTNDAPDAAAADTIITDAGADGGLAIPKWALAWNDTDMDTADTLTATNVGGASGGSVVDFGVVLFFDDSTLGGSFTYQATDGTATGAAGTATVINNAPGPGLVGTGADEILISALGDTASLDGGGGDDILIGNSGAHTLTGGSGNDIFAFQVVPDALNTITDFDNVSEDDMIAISASAFGSGLTAGMDTSLVFESSPDGEFFGSLFHYDETASILYFSSDGTTGSAIVVAQLQSGVFLSSQDLMIV